ncbi:MAG: hypothetical protein K6A78_07375 [Prevotella sp.]|nr:hypothetical protein [Prevotella sp.]
MSETIKKYGLEKFLHSSFVGNEKIAIFADEFKKHIKDGKEKRTRGERNQPQRNAQMEHEAEQLGGRSNQGRKVKSSERVGREKPFRENNITSGEVSINEDEELFRDAEERDRVTARGM